MSVMFKSLRQRIVGASNFDFEMSTILEDLGLYKFVRGFGWAYKRGAYIQMGL